VETISYGMPRRNLERLGRCLCNSDERTDLANSHQAALTINYAYVSAVLTMLPSDWTYK
jgi:hypothetical protein